MEDAYRSAGVDIAAGQRATELMKAAVRSTYGPEVLSDTGSFGGLFAAHTLKEMTAPVLVASTDGVGTKTMVAAKMNRWDTIGQDLVNHCVNDILVQGARPLFFLDYVASSQLHPEQIADVVGGCALACRAVGCALLGGETAEMPGVYQTGELDLAGTIVGVVEHGQLIDGTKIQAGDVVLALPSTGLHTNGYSLARHVLAELDWSAPHDALNGASIGDTLLAVHRCYLGDVDSLRQAGIDIHGLAHITGGGVYDNVPRILPDGLGAVLERGTWAEPLIFALIHHQGQVTDREMFHVFNMGLGMLVVVAEAQANVALAAVPELRRVGYIVEQAGVEVRGV
ncbi:MAG: phosphoribosylformylglycinamidine cyclo-ligase [Anaerolineae bacterium]